MTRDTPAEALDELLARADEAARAWAATAPAQRAGALRATADALDAHAGELLPLARAETRLLDGRLAGELSRTTFQLRLLAEVAEEGSCFDARIDHADDSWPMGPRPDLRRQLEPLGPVVNFAAGNFPFAFSVAGGDTASALAAGCPVLVKAHPGHPELSDRTAEIAGEALRAAGAPRGVLAVVHGAEAGAAALRDPRVRAGAFTGSTAGGRALFDIACARPEPIPFYGELSSVNPAFVTEAAAAARPEPIARGFLGSFSLGMGQFCTKPGVLAVPDGSAILTHLRAATGIEPTPLLNQRFQDAYARALSALAAHPGVEPLARDDAGAHADPPVPTLLTTTVERVLADPGELLAECFGPAALVVTYAAEADLPRLASAFDGQLTAALFGEDDDAIAPGLLRLLATRAGRVLWNQWPTGVTVSHAQQHGGPYPATTAPTSTSVGTAAITRFLRPVAYQGVPEHLLPDALKESNPRRVPRRIDGELVDV